MTQQTEASSGLNWLLDSLVSRVPETRHAIVLSEDGLPVGKSNSLDRDHAEHLSAVASGLQSLASGAARRFQGGPVRQTVIEMEKAFLFVTNAGQGARLAVLASDEVDAGMVVYEMNMLVKQVGRYLSAAPRTDTPSVGHGKEF